MALTLLRRKKIAKIVKMTPMMMMTTMMVFMGMVKMVTQPTNIDAHLNVKQRLPTRHSLVDLDEACDEVQ